MANDVRPEYERGHLGKERAEGVFIVGSDGQPVSFQSGQAVLPTLVNHSTTSEAEAIQLLMPANPNRTMALINVVDVFPFDSINECALWVSEVGDNSNFGPGADGYVPMRKGDQVKILGNGDVWIYAAYGSCQIYAVEASKE